MASGDPSASQPETQPSAPQSSAPPVETVSNPEPAIKAPSPPSVSYAALLRYATRRERQATALGCLAAVVTGGRARRCPLPHRLSLLIACLPASHLCSRAILQVP